MRFRALTVTIVVPCVLGHDLPQMLLAENQQVIGKIAAKHAYEAFHLQRQRAYCR